MSFITYETLQQGADYFYKDKFYKVALGYKTTTGNFDANATYATVASSLIPQGTNNYSWLDFQLDTTTLEPLGASLVGAPTTLLFDQDNNETDMYVNFVAVLSEVQVTDLGGAVEMGTWLTRNPFDTAITGAGEYYTCKALADETWNTFYAGTSEILYWPQENASWGFTIFSDEAIPMLMANTVTADSTSTQILSSPSEYDSLYISNDGGTTFTEYPITAYTNGFNSDGGIIQGNGKLCWGAQLATGITIDDFDIAQPLTIATVPQEERVMRFYSTDSQGADRQAALDPFVGAGAGSVWISKDGMIPEEVSFSDVTKTAEGAGFVYEFLGVSAQVDASRVRLFTQEPAAMTHELFTTQPLLFRENILPARVLRVTFNAGYEF